MGRLDDLLVGSVVHEVVSVCGRQIKEEEQVLDLPTKEAGIQGHLS